MISTSLGGTRRVVRLVHQLGHLVDKAALHRRLLGDGELPRDEQVAVGAEGLVGLLEVHQASDVGLLAPVVEIPEEPPGVGGAAVGPGGRSRQPIEQRAARDRQELLAGIEHRRRGRHVRRLCRALSGGCGCLPSCHRSRLLQRRGRHLSRTPSQRGLHSFPCRDGQWHPICRQKVAMSRRQRREAISGSGRLW